MGSIPTRSRQWRAVLAVRRLIAMLLLGVAAAVVAPGAARAQRTDTARVRDTSRTRGDTAGKRVAPPRTPRLLGVNPGPRVRPRTAFLRSLAVPGWGQSSLDRGTAGTLFTVIEVMSVAMVIKSKSDLDFAKRHRDDRVFQGYKPGPNGGPQVDSLGHPTGPTNPIYEPSPLASRVKARRQHLEDWIAAVAFNHLFSGADAFVAAHLSDIPPEISLQPEGGGMTLAARVSFGGPRRRR